jgi:hypothetical protein
MAIISKYRTHKTLDNENQSHVKHPPGYPYPNNELPQRDSGFGESPGDAVRYNLA